MLVCGTCGGIFPKTFLSRIMVTPIAMLVLSRTAVRAADRPCEQLTQALRKAGPSLERVQIFPPEVIT